jgi:beta-glucanase (GH16 family)
MRVSAFFCTALLLASCQSVSDAPEASPFRTLTFSDEFNGTGQPDPTKWQSESYNRRKNDTGPDGWWDPDYVRLDGEGHLVLSVDKIPNRNDDADSHDYASGMVSTKGLFEQRYGRFEARAKLPRETGWWAAFWLFSTSTHNVDGSGRDGTEIDIMEGFGRSDRLTHALHWDSYGRDHKEAVQRLERPGLRDGFHTYALEWSPDEYVFYVDGEETWRTDAGGVSQVPAYVKVTAEISSLDWATGPKWAGPLSDDAYPDSFVIDYVRVWSR